MKVRSYAVGLVLILLLALPIGGILAAPDRQAGPTELQMFSPPVRGTLSGSPLQYSFTMNEGEVFSLQLRLLNPALQVQMAITGPTGKPVGTGQAVAGTPDLIAAGPLIAPVAGDFTVTLTPSGTETGDFILRLMPGFPLADRWDTFDTPPGPLGMEWNLFEDTDSSGAIQDGQMQVTVNAPNTFVFVDPSNGRDWTDLYIEADVNILGNPSYYEYGFVFQYASDMNQFYAVSFSSDGDWWVGFYTPSASWSTVQDWTTTPLVDGGDHSPHIGLYVQGDTFRVYFNRQLVGKVATTYPVQAGSIGLVAATLSDQTDADVVAYDNLLISVPVSDIGSVSLDALDDTGEQVNPAAPSPTPASGMPFGLSGGTKIPNNNAPTPTGMVIPTSTPKPPAPTLPPLASSTPEPTTDQLTSWSSDQPMDVVRELQNMGLIGPGGDMAMTVPVSYGETSSSGYSFYPLGQGSSYRNLVMGFDAHLDITGPMSACGVHIRDTNQVSSPYSSTSAMVTEDGYAFLALFDENGNVDPNSAMETTSSINAGQGAVNRVIIVANESDVRMYVNGVLAVSAKFNAVYAGNVALEMYVSADDNGNTQDTYCQLDNIWLWEF